MKKGIILCSILLLLTGCSVDYNLEFNENIISENINGTLKGNIYEIAEISDGDGYYLEKELVNNNIPSYTDNRYYYIINIDANNNYSNVSLIYQYPYEEFKDSYLINNCFENKYVINSKDYLAIDLSGNFSCFIDSNIDIKVKSSYEVIKHNADEVRENYYIWHMILGEDKNIVFEINKNLNEIKEFNYTPLKIIVFVFILLTGGLIFFLNKKNKY